jgi:tyrosine decarboxylase/tyrosine decarboxylase/aspartate 1-decarboxylase
MCSRPLQVAVEAYRQTIHTNLGDSRLFPGIAALEGEVVRMLGALLGHRRAVGRLVSGGTEANLLALYVAREIGREKGIKHPEVVTGLSAHFSIEKCAAVLNLKVRYVPLGPDLHPSPAGFEKWISPRTVALVATAGSSDLGLVDDVPAIACVARKHRLYLHVDAASGGFIIPFARELGHPLPRIDFCLKGVHSITVDPHKFALSVVPGGAVLFRSQQLLSRIRFPSHFFDTPAHQTLLGTRPGASVASVYAVLRHLGRNGLRSRVATWMERRLFLERLLASHGYQILVPPELTIVAVRTRSPVQTMRRLRQHGWFVSVSRRHRAIRLVVHEHLRRVHLRQFVEALCRVQPVTKQC